MSWMCQCPRELADTRPVCDLCQTERPAAASGPSSKCEVCLEATRQVQLTTALIDMGGDGITRCASCHVDYLRECARRDPISPADLAKCKAQLEDAYRRAGEKWDTKRL